MERRFLAVFVLSRKTNLAKMNLEAQQRHAFQARATVKGLLQDLAWRTQFRAEYTWFDRVERSVRRRPRPLGASPVDLLQ